MRSMWSVLLLTVTGAAAFMPAGVLAQFAPVAPETPRFDVVSVKRTTTNESGGLTRGGGPGQHAETRDMPIYARVPVHADGRPGGGLTPTSPGESAAAAPQAPPGAGVPPPCGGIQFGPGQLIARGATMAQFATTLMGTAPVTGIDRMVVDRTGLTGQYAFTLRFAAVGRGGGPPVCAGGGAPERPAFATALQEECGSKLEPQRAPIDVVVVDSIERPEDN